MVIFVYISGTAARQRCTTSVYIQHSGSMTSEALRQQFRTVFALQDLPQDGDVGVVTTWLLSHQGKPPSRRCLAAMKTIHDQHCWTAIIKHYIEHIRMEILPLNITDLDKLVKIKEYFMLPLQYLHLTALEFALVERTVDSLIRMKIEAMDNPSLEQEQFLLSIGMDTCELNKLRNEREIGARIAALRGIWDRSVLNELPSEFSRIKLAHLRMTEIFDIVLDYPASIPSLQDLRVCLQPNQRNDLVDYFTSTCTERLLHAGINTESIILCFISTIKSFLEVDPAGVLLDSAFRPIKKYLNSRSDTVHVVVNALINSETSDTLSGLVDELTMVSDEYRDELTLDWTPAPIDALPDFRKQDIIDALISLNEKRVFIEELETVCAHRLLSSNSDEQNKLAGKLMCLKSKFGENELNRLDVMLDDISKSKQLDTVIHKSNAEISRDLQFYILSHAYWPDFEEEDEAEFTPPEPIQHQISLYEKAYKDLNKGRVMKCLNRGSVEIELEFENRSVTVNVEPLDASVIACFHEKESHELSDILKALKVSSELVTKSLSFWIDLGILTFEGNKYNAVANPDSEKLHQFILSKDDKTQLLDFYWDVIAGMLKSLGPMTLSQVYNYLTSVIPDGNKTSLVELEAYLKLRVENGDISNQGNQYDWKR